MASLDIAYIVSVIGGLIGIVLLGTTWFYLDKLENTGCACAEHPYRNFLKNYAVFAIAYVAITMFFPPAVTIPKLGLIGGAIYAGVNVLFSVATLVFFVLAIIYARYLMKEKCKCSEDVRREVLYYWSILEVVILGSMLLLTLITPVITNAFALVASTTDHVGKAAANIRDAVVNPIGSATKVPQHLKKLAKGVVGRR